MSATESRKDELAMRALSNLPDPPLPDGLAARIAARAAAFPQIGTVGIEPAPVTALRSIVAVPAGELGRRSPRRWRAYAAASVAAAALLSIGILAGIGSGQDDRPALASEKAVSPLPRSEQQPPAELADAAPRDAKPAKRPGKEPQVAGPAMLLPVPVTPAEPAPEEGPAESSTPSSQIVPGEERLAQTGPQVVPQSGIISAPVYGPPAPSGLGIAGSVNGPASIPNEAGDGSRAPRGGSPGPSPGGIPGGSTPRGPGPRH